MIAHVELNIFDVREAVIKHLAEKYPGVNIVGFTVKSWNTEIFSVNEDCTMLNEPVRHVIRDDHSALK